MKTINLECPKCKTTFHYKNILVWILKAPFHYFNKRKTKCPNCNEWSWIRRKK